MLSSGVGVVRRVWLVVRLPHFQDALGGLGLWLGFLLGSFDSIRQCILGMLVWLLDTRPVNPFQTGS